MRRPQRSPAEHRVLVAVVIDSVSDRLPAFLDRKCLVELRFLGQRHVDEVEAVESGCGKSTLARLIARIDMPDAGLIRFAGHDITFATPAEIRPLLRRMQMIFQDPYASLNPRMTVGDILAEPLRFHGLTSDNAMTTRRVDELLSLVGLSPQALAKYPHEFSGSQRQRISIARALAVAPEFIVADEPISSLDVNIGLRPVDNVRGDFLLHSGSGRP